MCGTLLAGGTRRVFQQRQLIPPHPLLPAWDRNRHLLRGMQVPRSLPRSSRGSSLRASSHTQLRPQQRESRDSHQQHWKRRSSASLRIWSWRQVMIGKRLHRGLTLRRGIL